MVFQGANVPFDHLLTIPHVVNVWDTLKDLNITAVRPNGGQSGNKAHIDVTRDVDWAQNLDAILALADSHGIKVVLHQMGGPWSTETLMGLDAPYFNYMPYVATPIPEALDIIDKIGGDNVLGHNFFTDDRMPYWQPINEAPFPNDSRALSSNPTVEEWGSAVYDRIHVYGGKTTASIIGNNGNGRYTDFRLIMPWAQGHLDFLQAHEDLYYAAVTEFRNGLDPFTPILNTGIREFGQMIDEGGAGGYGPDRIILGEWGVGHGSWLRPGNFSLGNVSMFQFSRYLEAAFQAMRDVGLVNHYHHEIYDQSREQWGIMAHDGVKHPEPYAAFKAGMAGVPVPDVSVFLDSSPVPVNFTVNGTVHPSGTTLVLPSGVVINIRVPERIDA